MSAQAGAGSQSAVTAQDLNRDILKDVKPYIRKHHGAKRELVNPRTLPDAAMFAVEGAAYLKWQDRGLRWTFDGYDNEIELPGIAQRLTPRMTCSALLGGYTPQIDPTAIQR